MLPVIFDRKIEIKQIFLKRIACVTALKFIFIRDGSFDLFCQNFAQTQFSNERCIGQTRLFNKHSGIYQRKNGTCTLRIDIHNQLNYYRFSQR